MSTLPFNIIQNSSVLAASDFQELEKLTDELQDTFLKSQVFRTRTEAEISVLNDDKHPTPASKYWQSVREQGVMFHELVMLSYEYRKNLIEIKKLERDMEKKDDELDKELDQIEIERKRFISKDMEKIAKDRIREIKMWSEIKAREAKSMSEAELAEVDTHQLVSYTKRFIKERVRMADGGSPAERRNLIGQLETSFKACRELGILQSILEEVPDYIRINLGKENLLFEHEVKLLE
jgi:hypothetical protein